MHKGELGFYSIRDYVRILLAELEHATPKPVLIGHGLGAWLALRAAEECELPGVVLIGCPPLSGMFGPALRTFAAHPLWASSQLSSGFASPWGEAESIAESLFGGPAPHGSESRCVLRELLRRPVAFPGKVTAPVLVVSAERDRLVPASRHAGLAQALANATHQSISAAPHDVYGLEWAPELTELIASWSSSFEAT